MASTDKKKFKITETSKQASVDITSDKIILPADSDDHLLVATVPSGANVNATVNVEVEMSPDGENWCPALLNQTVTTSGSTTSEVKGNEQYADLTVNAPVYNGHGKGGLHFDNSGNTTTEDAGTRDFMHQHIEANKCFNQSMWFKTSEQPSSGVAETVTFAVTVVSTSEGNKYFIDGVQQDTLNLKEGSTYTLDQSDSSNSGHPLRLSTTSNGSHGGGSEYTTGVTVVGTPGTSGAYTRIVVAASAPTLFYYCTQHSGMGGTANTPVNDTYKPVLFRHGGYDNFTNAKTVQLTGTTGAGSTTNTQSGFGNTFNFSTFVLEGITPFDNYTIAYWWDSSDTSLNPSFSMVSNTTWYGLRCLDYAFNGNLQLGLEYPYYSNSANGGPGYILNYGSSTNPSFTPDGTSSYLIIKRHYVNGNGTATVKANVYKEDGTAVDLDLDTGDTVYDFSDTYTMGSQYPAGSDNTAARSGHAHIQNIDNLCIVAESMSDSDMANLYVTSGSKILPADVSSISNIQAWWRFGDNGADTLADVANNITAGGRTNQFPSVDSGSTGALPSLGSSHALYNLGPGKLTQNLCDPVITSNRYDSDIQSITTSTLSELDHGNLTAFAPNKNWTYITMDNGASSTSNTPSCNTWQAHLDGIAVRYGGPSSRSQYATNRYIIGFGSLFVGNSRTELQTLFGVGGNQSYYVYSNLASGTPSNGIAYLTPGDIDEAIIMVATNSFNSSTNVATLTIKIYQKKTGTLLVTHERYSNALSSDIQGFFDGTGTTNITQYAYNDGSTGNPGYIPYRLNGVKNLILSKHLPDQTAINDYLVAASSGGIDITDNVAQDSDVVALYKMGNGENDTPGANGSAVNYAGVGKDATAFPTLTLSASRDMLTSPGSFDDGFATQLPALQGLFTTTSNTSISGWFKTTDTGTLFSNTDGAAVDGLRMEVMGSNTLSLLLIDSAQAVSATANVNDGEWHHLVVTKPSGTTPTIKIYVDGVEKASVTVSTISDDDLKGGNGFTLLGDGQENANNTSAGVIDASKVQATLSNWSLHSEVLDVNAISQLYSNGHVRNIKNLPSVTAANIKAWWQLENTSTPQNDLSGQGRHLVYEDGASAAITTKLVNSDGATYVNGSINGNAITMSLTKSFNFTTKKWVATADQDSAICLSFNGFEEQAEYFALWKCTQTVPSGSVNILDGGWHNLILSYRGINDLTGNNNVVAGTTEVRFGVGDGATDEEYHFTLSIDGYPMALVSGTDKVGADYIGGLGSTLATESIDGVSKNVKFVIEDRHLRYDSNNNEEEYKPHGQFSAAIHPFSASETDPNNFRGSVDETSFHSQCFWLNQGSTGVQATINQEKPYTIYGRTTALDNRGTSNTYPTGVPYPLLNPELLKASEDINDMINTNQFINPVPKGQTQPWNSQVSTGGLEAWYRWGDTDGDCSVDIKDVRTHIANGYDRFLTAVELDDTANIGNVKSAQGESIYLQSQSASTSSGSSSTSSGQVKLEDLAALVGTAACTIKNMSSQVLQYLRIKLTGNGTCDIGENKLKVEIHYKKRRMK